MQNVPEGAAEDGGQGAYLFLLRSPFQAFLARRIVEQHGLSPVRVVYISRENEEKDRYYYGALAEVADQTLFMRVGRNRAEMLRNPRQLAALARWIRRCTFRQVILANFAFWYFRAVARWIGAPVATMDDGTMNYRHQDFDRMSSDRAHDRRMSRLAGGYRLDEFLDRVTVHYAFRPDLPNFIDAPIRPVELVLAPSASPDAPPQPIMLGQPFEEYLDPDAIARLMAFREALGGAYFPHPRERRRGFPVIESPLLIEDYVSRLDRPAVVFGGYTTAFLTLSACRRIYLDLDRNAGNRAFMEHIGCEAVNLHDARTLDAAIAAFRGGGE